MNTSSSNMSCVLRLDIQTRGWEKSVHKLLIDIRDVTYRIDGTRGLAYVTGKISPEIILRFRKAKKHGQLININYGHTYPPVIPQAPYNYPPSGFNHPQPPQPRIPPPAQPHWPRYMYYGNQSPYEQTHVAYPYRYQYYQYY